MGMFDKKQRDEPNGYSTHDEAAGGVLMESTTHLDAIERSQRASDLTPTQVTTERTPPVIRRTEIKAPDQWHAETFIVDPGKVMQILGRDEDRASADVTNQTNLENNAGNGTPVFLFGDIGAAQAFVNAVPAPKSGRFSVIPDGAAREMHHTASVWAAVRADAAGSVVIDVTVERYKHGARA